MSADTGALFTPFTINQLELPNRIVMAPMTRNFAPDYTPVTMSPPTTVDARRAAPA